MKPFKKVKSIHFVGIGGAGMIGIARVLLKKGYKISGSDISDSIELRKLKKDGAKVFKNVYNDKFCKQFLSKFNYKNIYLILQFS